LERLVIEVLVGRRVKLSSSAVQPDVSSRRDPTQLTDSRSPTRHDALPTSPYERRTGRSLDARAMYLAGKLYRLHGSNEPDNDRASDFVWLRPHEEPGRDRPL
jgi:hypothetical protein